METTHWTTSRLLLTAARLNEHHQNRRLTGLGVTQAGATALAALSASGPISQSGLAGLVHVQAQTIGRVLEKLELRGLVVRARNTIDQRCIRIRITQRGEDVVEGVGQLAGAPAASVESPDEALRDHLMSIITRFQAVAA